MNIVDSFIEVELEERDDFLKVKETLTRIGISSFKDRKLYQSCHILHKRGKYYIVHSKELFALDGKPTNFSSEDRMRRNAIAMLLQEWNLIRVITPIAEDDCATANQIKIISHKEKKDWELVAKYSIGNKK